MVPSFGALRREVEHGVGTIARDRPDAPKSLEATLKRERVAVLPPRFTGA
jgi:hypothetical protein